MLVYFPEGPSSIFSWRIKAKSKGKINSELLLKSLEASVLDEIGEVIHSVSGSGEVNLRGAVNVHAKTLGRNLCELFLNKMISNFHP